MTLGRGLENWLFKHFENKILHSTFIYYFSSVLYFFMLIQAPTLIINFCLKKFFLNVPFVPGVPMADSSLLRVFIGCFPSEGRFGGMWNSELAILLLCNVLLPRCLACVVSDKSAAIFVRFLSIVNGSFFL